MQLLSLARVAALLDVSERSVRRWMIEADFPKPIHLPGRTPRWDEEEVKMWVLKQKFSPVSDDGVKGKSAGAGSDRK
jgi:predicted DNA-binding transcriptional regulator AlpA